MNFKFSNLLFRANILLAFFTIPTFSHQVCSQTQNPYSWNAGADASILGIGAVSSGIGLLLGHKTRKLTPADLQNLDVQEITPKFDRRATRKWSPEKGKTSDLLLKIGLACPAPLLASGAIRKSNLALLGTMGLETYLLAGGLTALTKSIARRKRPFVYNAAAPEKEKFSLDARQSFFSGHTSMSAAGSFFAAKVFSDFYPESKFRPLVWAGAATIPALTGLHRYFAGKHFPSDILVGYLVGGACGWLVPELHKKKSPTSESDFLPALSLGGATVFALTLTF